QIVPQGISAEVLAEEWSLSREKLDAYSFESHRRAIAAIDEGRFDNEVVPVEVTNPHVGAMVGVDETPRRDTSLEKLAALQPAFIPDGKVTAGNSSQICDGAAAVLIASEAAASRLGVEPRARVTATLVNELERRDARYGIASMCIGFGMALAGVIERL